MHPENKVIDAIDRLVEESLRKPQDDYNAPFSEACEHCGYQWHGIPNGLGCPGAYATDQQLGAWREIASDARQLICLDEGSFLFHGVVLLGHVDSGDDGTIHATLALFPRDEGLLMFPALPDAPPETFDLDPAFVDIGFLDESSHDDSVPYRVVDTGLAFDENASMLVLFRNSDDQDTPES